MTFETLIYKKPAPNNRRNSEGDFARLPDGRILFAYSSYLGGREDEEPCNVAGLFSNDGGRSFSSDPAILVCAAEHGVNNVMSVSLLPMENGDVGLFYIVKGRDGSNDYVLRRTRDGKSFSAPVSCIPEKRSRGMYYVVNNARVLRTGSGRIIVPVAVHRNGEADLSRFDGRAVNTFFFSDDDGQTWRESADMIFPPHAARSETGLQEPGIVELPSGALYAWARTDMFCQYESFSADNLESFSPAQPSRFYSPASPLSIRQNPFTGEYFAVWNPVPDYNGRKRHDWSWGRTPLVYARSADGRNFSAPVILEDDETRGFCYPALFFPDRGTMLLSYCCGGIEEGGPLTCLKIIRLEI